MIFLIAHFKFATAPATNPVGIRNNTGSGSNANILRLDLTHRQAAASFFSRFTLGGLAVVTRAPTAIVFFLGFGVNFSLSQVGTGTESGHWRQAEFPRVVSCHVADEAGRMSRLRICNRERKCMLEKGL